MQHTVFGIRHHGPGCARSLLSALEAMQPDAVVIEGPPDAEPVLELMADGTAKPPVALLIYPVDEPARSVYFPMAEFSPEWQALTFALTHKIPVFLMDLPMKHHLALEKQREEELRKEVEKRQAAAETEQHTGNGEAKPDILQSDETPQEEQQPEAATDSVEHAGEQPHAGNAGADMDLLLREDPVGVLAMAAGYEDRELWWEHQIEQRRDASGLFEGIMEAMTELRSSLNNGADQTSDLGAIHRRYENLREAYMRQTLRRVKKEGYQKVAVVCGAWHAPVLRELGPAKADQQLLTKLPSCKTTATWIPWSNSRLAYRSGYGAGVTCPGWYEHLWHDPNRPHVRWITRAARLLREQDLDASAASVIEAIRLSESLAALRDLPLPGLTEVSEAILTVLCSGNDMPMALVREKLEIGDRLGLVPASTPMVPLQRDLEALQKSLRLKPSTEIRDLTLDLRKDNDRAKSQLLHRLRLLEISWGNPIEVGGTGTYKEGWRLQWQVEFAVQIIEANVWGNTVESAANARATKHAQDANNLSELSQWLDKVILAELPDALNHVLDAFQQRVAVSSDVQHLMEALQPLARSQRYQDVRQTPVERLAAVFDVLFERVLVDLPPSVSSLNDEAAANIVEGMRSVQASLNLLQAERQLGEWVEVLRPIMERDEVHGLVRGTCCRLLFDGVHIDDAELQRLAGLSLALQWPPQQAAAWLQGLLAGSGLALVHQHGLWHALDRWLTGLSEESFVEMLPLVRRSFSSFSGPERREISKTIKSLKPGPTATATTTQTAAADLNLERANNVLPILRHIMGVDHGN